MGTPLVSGFKAGQKNGSYNCYTVFMLNHWGNLIGRIPPKKKLIASRMFSVVGNPRRTGHLPLDLAVLGPEGRGEVSKGGLGGTTASATSGRLQSAWLEDNDRTCRREKRRGKWRGLLKAKRAQPSRSALPP